MATLKKFSWWQLILKMAIVYVPTEFVALAQNVLGDDNLADNWPAHLGAIVAALAVAGRNYYQTRHLRTGMPPITLKGTSIILICCAVAWPGCHTGGSAPVAQANMMVGQTLTTLQKNTETAIDDFGEDLSEAYGQGIRARIVGEADKMTDAAGMINRADYDQLLAEAAAKSAENEAYIANKKAQYKATLREQFAVARELNAAVQRYEEATGISPESFQAFLDSGVALGQQIQDLRRQSADADRIGDQEKKAKLESNIGRLMKLLRGGKTNAPK